jgi:hypothetical protein
MKATDWQRLSAAALRRRQEEAKVDLLSEKVGDSASPNRKPGAAS